MEDETRNANAQAEYELLCQTLDEIEVPYTKEEEKLVVRFKIQRDEKSVPLTYYMRIFPDAENVLLLSPLQLEVPEDKRFEMSYAINGINTLLFHGVFDFDIKEGSILFRVSTSFIDSIVGAVVFVDLIRMTDVLVNKFHGDLLALAEGNITLDQFIEKL